MHSKKGRNNKLLKDISMFASFMAVSGFVYVFHIFQNNASLRGYLTATALLVSYVLQYEKYDRRNRCLWACFFAWVVYSNIYYDIRTHWSGGGRLARHIAFAVFPIAAATKSIKNSGVLRFLFWATLVVGPEISSNVYGNALFSIIRVFTATICIMVRVRPEDVGPLVIEQFVWVFFCHETLLALAVPQLMFDFLPIEASWRWPFVHRLKTAQLPADVIGERDVPFFDRKGTGTVIGHRA
jgi:hypothetical protein